MAAFAVYFNRDVLNTVGNRGAYGYFTGKREVGDMANTRSSGLGRMAGVAAVILLTRVLMEKHILRFALLPAIATFGYVVYIVHSRGAMLSLVGGLAVVVFLASVSRKTLMVIVGLSLFLVVMKGDVPTYVESAKDYIRRGQSDQNFTSMTGRTEVWSEGIEVFQRSPLIGWGNWADRYLIGEHVHNTYMQALLNGGVIGFIPFILSWIIAWLFVFQIWRRSHFLSEKDNLIFVEVTGVLMFFTLRSVPETTTASYSIDLLLMIPVFVFLEVLYRKVNHLNPKAQPSSAATPEASRPGLAARQRKLRTVQRRPDRVNASRSKVRSRA